MQLHLLYPCEPIQRQNPDELYAEEHAEGLQLGFTVSLFSFEDFLAGDFRTRPSLVPGQTVLYRGWMLTPQHYKRLHSAITGLGATPATSPEQYERCHDLPGWYGELREFTPATYFFKETEDVAGRLGELSWTGCFLKDHVKSLTLEGGSMIRDLSTIPRVIEKMKSFREEIEGGLCARQIEDFDSTTEERYFVFRGQPFSRTNFIPDVVQVAADRIDSPFFTVDTVVRRDGVMRIIELGDGQVSDRKNWSVGRFLEILRE